jgi:hypothetical protein
MGPFGRIMIVAALGLGLGGCASSSFDDEAHDAPPARVASALARESGTNYVESQAGQQALQCVPYAREHSAIKITGDAYTRWDQAAGRHERDANPAAGTVMVLCNYAGPQRGHVGAVRRMISAREIRIDHANWLDNGDDEAAPALMACNDEAPAPPPVQRVAVVTPPHAKAKPAARTAAPDPVVPATIILEDRNPPAESGFALTAEYRALP